MKNILVIILILSPFVIFSQEEWWENSERQEIKKDTVQAINKGEENPFSTFSELHSEDTSNVNKNYRQGNVSIKRSPAVEKIIEFKAATIPPFYGPTMEGFRVQLFFDQNKDEVEKKRKEAIELDDKKALYVKYEAPNYFLLLGDYRTKLEAEKVRSEMLADFPEAIIRADKIYFPKISEKEE